MTDQDYRELAVALDRLPNGFPKTDSSVEIEILKLMFSPEEARITAAMSMEMEPPEQIAGRLGLDARETEARLRLMAQSGLVMAMMRDGKRVFRLRPFVIGSYEAQLSKMSHQLAHLMEEYVVETGGLVGIMTPRPALTRVVPAHGSVKSEWILPYDDVKAMLMEAKSLYLRNCICRVEQDYVGSRKCEFPLKTCLSFSPTERPASPESISRDEALAFLDKAEEMGLVHCVSNIAKGMSFVCNCCGCCCGILRGITQFGIKDSVAYANYFATVDPDLCVGCGICAGRCQVGAISMRDSTATIDLDRCIGCGVCVTGCAAGAAQLKLKPESEITHPPLDMGMWEKMRLASRGMK